jgi:hypothetical protein
MSKYYVQCSKCLSKAVVEVEAAPYRSICASCEGECRVMGKVQGDRYARVENRCPCDSRCTGAQGPTCDCSCGGANHGSNLVVPVVVEAGIVKIQIVATEEAKARRAEVEALVAEAKAAIEARWGEILAAKARGEWIQDWSSFMAAGRARDGIRHALKLNSHKGRTNGLRKVIAEVAA